MKKIAIVGPECTGKSWLAQKLAEHFSASWAPEFAREYIDRLDRPYNRGDLLAIAKGQAKMEDHVTEGAGDLLFCDTNLLVIKVWSEHKY
ncbi:MAG TPA: ATP-binding protein, partial [Cyclobacteriaceae bacterium]|nr:ATP-binding protein [Cyclobacteriaceae bacterium]